MECVECMQPRNVSNCTRTKYLEISFGQLKFGPMIKKTFAHERQISRYLNFKYNIFLKIVLPVADG